MHCIYHALFYYDLATCDLFDDLSGRNMVSLRRPGPVTYVCFRIMTNNYAHKHLITNTILQYCS